jgi:outer membrane protein TolC
MTRSRSLALAALLALGPAARASAQQPAGPPAPAPQAPPALTLARAQELALRQASALTQAEQGARVAELEVRQARVGFLPVITAPLSYIFTSPLHGPEQKGVPLTMRPPAFIANDAINQYVLLANATGEIDINGKLGATVDRTRAELARARAVALVARRGLAAAVTGAYYGLALARGKREVAEQVLQSALDFEHTTELMFEGGEVAELDTVKATVDVTARRDELLQARAAEVEAAETLNALTGIPFGTPTVVQDLGLALPEPADLAGFDAEQVGRRPELAQLEAEARSADADVRIARAERRPSLSYTVSAGVDDERIAPSRDLGASASVTLSVPIVDWGAARSRQRQAEIRRDAARSNRELVERALLMQFATARAQASLAAERIRLAGSAVADAARALDISVARYEAGEAPTLEVTDARSTLAAERTAFYQAIFDYRIALDRLLQAVGR